MSDIYFNSHVGRINGRYHQGPSNNSPMALILHPDPLQGGTMNNKVSYTVFKAFVQCGFSALRINFPGVGNSFGTPGNGEDEFAVASCALDWMQHVEPESSHFWIGGFSFGSWIGMQVATRRPEIERFVFVAPPVEKYDFSFSIPSHLPGLVISGGKDTIAPIDKVSKLVTEWSRRPECQTTHHIIPEAEHFFDGYLDEIFNVSVDYINTAVAMRIAKPVRKKRRRRRKRDRELSDEDS